MSTQGGAASGRLYQQAAAPCAHTRHLTKMKAEYDRGRGQVRYLFSNIVGAPGGHHCGCLAPRVWRKRHIEHFQPQLRAQGREQKAAALRVEGQVCDCL